MLVSPKVESKTLDEVKQLVDCGELENVVEILDSLSSINPKNPDIDLVKAEYFIASGDKANARQALEQARKKGSADAILKLAEIELNLYDLNSAQNLLDSYSKGLKKNQKPSEKYEELSTKMNKIHNMLERVEKITIIDSLIVDKKDFFKHYRLSPESGYLVDSNSPSNDFQPLAFSSAYLTEDKQKLIIPGIINDNSSIYSEELLVNGEWDSPEDIGSPLADGGTLNFPFLMSDGLTLYFASNGDNSLGGYDIFVSRNNGDTFLQPQNIGMPYNSPYDDYLMAIDEINGIGWWATDRNQIPGKVTIYIFIPSEKRENLPKDDISLKEKAFITSIGLTQDGRENEIENKLAILAEMKNQIEIVGEKKQFEISMPDGTTRTSIEQFNSQAARNNLRKYLDLLNDIENNNSLLAKLYEEYSKGNHSVSRDILSLENKTLTLKKETARMVNEIVKAETSR